MAREPRTQQYITAQVADDKSQAMATCPFCQSNIKAMYVPRVGYIPDGGCTHLLAFASAGRSVGAAFEGYAYELSKTQ